MNKGCMDRLYSHIDLRRQRNQQGLLFTFYDVFNYLSIADEIAVSEMIFLLKYSNIRNTPAILYTSIINIQMS